jgi:hypothetical protein
MLLSSCSESETRNLNRLLGRPVDVHGVRDGVVVAAQVRAESHPRFINILMAQELKRVL